MGIRIRINPYPYPRTVVSNMRVISSKVVRFALQRRRRALLRVWVGKKQAQNASESEDESNVEWSNSELNSESIEGREEEEDEDEEKVEEEEQSTSSFESTLESGTRLAVSLKCWLLRAMPC